MTSTFQDRVDGFTVTKAVKAPVKAATTATAGNITLSGEQTIDGVSLVDGDRVLVKNQTDDSENGLYVVKEGAWQRAKDFNGARDVGIGTLVRVTNGTQNADSYWVASAASEPITVGTDSITFSRDNYVLGEGGLSDEILALIASLMNTASWQGAWATSTSYSAGDTVSKDGIIYMAIEAHTSGTFATDLAADKWVPISATDLTTTAVGNDVASASTLNLDINGIFHDVTGTTTITAMSSQSNGISRLKFLQFDASLTLTHHATNLILPNGVDYVTKAGEILGFYEYAAGDWRMISSSRTVNYGQGATEDLNFKDKVLSRAEIKDYAETRAEDTNANGGVSVDLENGNVQELTLTGNVVISFANPPASGKAGNITLILKQDANGGHTIGFSGSTIHWDGGTPDFSDGANEIDIVTLFTIDGGSTWYGFPASINIASGASKSHDTNGYTVLPDGTILQWGQADIPSGSTVNVTFELEFPNNCFQGYASGQEHDPGESTSAAVGANNFSTTGMTLWNNNNTEITASWWSVGN